MLLAWARPASRLPDSAVDAALSLASVQGAADFSPAAPDRRSDAATVAALHPFSPASRRAATSRFSPACHRFHNSHAHQGIKTAGGGVWLLDLVIVDLVIVDLLVKLP